MAETGVHECTLRIDTFNPSDYDWGWLRDDIYLGVLAAALPEGKFEYSASNLMRGNRTGYGRMFNSHKGGPLEALMYVAGDLVTVTLGTSQV